MTLRDIDFAHPSAPSHKELLGVNAQQITRRDRAICSCTRIIALSDESRGTVKAIAEQIAMTIRQIVAHPDLHFLTPLTPAAPSPLSWETKCRPEVYSMKRLDTAVKAIKEQIAMTLRLNNTSLFRRCLFWSACLCESSSINPSDACGAISPLMGDKRPTEGRLN